MKSRPSKRLIVVMLSVLVVVAFSTPGMAVVQGKYLYNLSSFTGTIPFEWVRVFFDRGNNEIYVSNRSDRSVRIFNENGMEVYSFGDDEGLGSVVDGQVEKDGNLLLLSYKTTDNGLGFSILRCNFRGEPKTEIEIKNLPANFSDIEPMRIVLRNESIYLADLNKMKVVVVDTHGLFKQGYDLVPMLELKEQQRADFGLGGFSVDKEGNIFLTVPTLFRAYKLSPDQKLVDFGRKGSAPGKFSVISGIVSDDEGYIYVADKLRCVVMIFDKEFRFQNEFGFRSLRPGGLIAPNDLEVDTQGRLYVTQMRKRGISVYRITYR